MSRARVEMTAELQAIWRSVYAAMLVSDFETSYNATGCDWDRAAEMTTAERAVTLADHAVAELDRWRGQEDIHVGRFRPLVEKATTKRRSAR